MKPLYQTRFNLYLNYATDKESLVDFDIGYGTFIEKMKLNALVDNDIVAVILENGKETDSYYFSDIVEGNNLCLVGSIENLPRNIEW